MAKEWSWMKEPDREETKICTRKKKVFENKTSVQWKCIFCFIILITTWFFYVNTNGVWDISYVSDNIAILGYIIRKINVSYKYISHKVWGAKILTGSFGSDFFLAEPIRARKLFFRNFQKRINIACAGYDNRLTPRRPTEKARNNVGNGKSKVLLFKVKLGAVPMLIARKSVTVSSVLIYTNSTIK